jgi:hypothetical protein
VTSVRDAARAHRWSLCREIARTDGVDVDVVFAPLGRERLGERDQRSLCSYCRRPRRPRRRGAANLRLSDSVKLISERNSSLVALTSFSQSTCLQVRDLAAEVELELAGGP